MAALARLADLAPTPDGATLTLPVLCATSSDMSGAVRHPVQIHPDWSVSTPHDLEAERVAAAFGGYLSCLHLVDAVLPVVRHTLQQHARRSPPRLRRGARGTWRGRPSVTAGCCRPLGTAAAAAAHLRSVEHAIARSAGHPMLVADVLDRLLSQHEAAGSFRLNEQQVRDLRRCVRGDNGPVGVWDAGLHPDVVVAIHDHVVGPQGPALPEALYLGVVARRPDLDWMAETVAAARDPQLAEWLAWTQTPLDTRHRDARAGWLATGVPRTWIEQLSTAGYCPGDAERLARHTRRGVGGASRMLLGWVRAGCRPTTDDLLELVASGVPPWYEPSRPTIERLQAGLGRLAERYTLTELGLLLAREGTATAADAAIRAHQASTPQAREECA